MMPVILFSHFQSIKRILRPWSQWHRFLQLILPFLAHFPLLSEGHWLGRQWPILVQSQDSPHSPHATSTWVKAQQKWCFTNTHHSGAEFSLGLAWALLAVEIPLYILDQTRCWRCTGSGKRAGQWGVAKIRVKARSARSCAGWQLWDHGWQWQWQRTSGPPTQS